MATYTCPTCGAVRETTRETRLPLFCSRECYVTAQDNGFFNESRIPNEPVKHKFVHPRGLDNLVAAMCQQARHDYLTNPPGNYIRADAERFFLSDYFAALTQLDGENIVNRLEEEYKRKKRRGRRNSHGYWE